MDLRQEMDELYIVYQIQTDFRNYTEEQFCDMMEEYKNEIVTCYESFPNIASAIEAMQLVIWFLDMSAGTQAAVTK